MSKYQIFAANHFTIYILNRFHFVFFINNTFQFQMRVPHVQLQNLGHHLQHLDRT